MKPDDPTNLTPIPRAPAKRLFLGFLGFAAVFYGVVVTYHLLVPRGTASDKAAMLERCREFCARYGLVSTGHVANDAQAYLAIAKPVQLTDTLQQILADESFVVAESQPHPLLGKLAPDFRLPNSSGGFVRLSELNKSGPVLVVFYYGYGCSHCVAQLFGIQEDLDHFQGLRTQIVALSGDTPEHTAAKFLEYGKFDFPVVSDADYSVADQYHVRIPPQGDKPEDLKHGTFIVDRSGKISFANLGNEPFIDNKSLLFLLNQESAREKK